MPRKIRPLAPAGARPVHSGQPRPATADQKALDNVVIVLDQPIDVVNIAGVIRGMMNMGLSRLRLVRPDDFDSYRIQGIAHRSSPIIAATEVHDTLDSAIADAVWVVGPSARPRTANRNYVRPREVAPSIIERTAEGPVCILFGREDRGLTNEGLDRCHAVAIIPTAPEYWSLNLAQAFLVTAYEIFLAAGGATGDLPRGRRSTEPATSEDLESMYAAVQEGLARIRFFKGARQPEAVLRTLRTILGRADLDARESRLIKAIGFEIGNYLDHMNTQA